jgi:Flp pilus assembly protein TadG
MKTDIRNRERGQAMVETAIAIPLLLVLMVGIFEVGRAYETWQVLTNAAREGARIAVLEAYTDAQVTATVRNYLTGGRLTNAAGAGITIVRNEPFGVNTASRVTVNYPFQFMVLSGVADLVKSDSSLGTSLTMQSSALMRNE